MAAGVAAGGDLLSAPERARFVRIRRYELPAQSVLDRLYSSVERCGIGRCGQYVRRRPATGLSRRDRRFDRHLSQSAAQPVVMVLGRGSAGNRRCVLAGPPVRCGPLCRAAVDLLHVQFVVVRSRRAIPDLSLVSGVAVVAVLILALLATPPIGPRAVFRAVGVVADSSTADNVSCGRYLRGHRHSRDRPTRLAGRRESGRPVRRGRGRLRLLRVYDDCRLAAEIRAEISRSSISALR